MVRTGAKGSMPTSRTGTWIKAFTLLELVVVLFLLALFATLTVPRLQAFLSAGNTDKAIRQIRSLALYLSQMAVSRRAVYRLNYDLKEGRCWVSRRSEQGEFIEEREMLSRPVYLPHGVRFIDVITPRGMQKEGTAYTEFFPTGWVERTLIHLEGNYRATLKLLPLIGEVRVYEGYVTEEE